MTQQKVKTEARTYTYDKIMIDESIEVVVIYSNPNHHPNDAYLGRGHYENWKKEAFSYKDFAKQILFGKIVVEEVPMMVHRTEITKILEWEKIESEVARMKERGFEVDNCPECGSDNIEYDGDAETDGCASDWATWSYWWVSCNDCDDFEHKGKFVSASGGRW